MCSYCCVWLSEFSKAGLTKYLTKRQESINRHIMSLDYLKFFSYTWISWYVTFVHVFGSWTLGLWESFMWWESVARSFSLCDILVCSKICFSIPELGGVWIVSRLRLPQKCYHRQLSQLALVINEHLDNSLWGTYLGTESHFVTDVPGRFAGLGDRAGRSHFPLPSCHTLVLGLIRRARHVTLDYLVKRL